MPIFFLIFIIIPLIEIFIFAEVGEAIGGLNTIILVLVTGAIGVLCVRTQGLSTLISAQQKMNSGEVPAEEMVNGIMIVVAGILLITPGFLTDFIGFMLFIPFIRNIFWGFFKVQGISGYTSATVKRSYDEENIIDADFEVVDEDDKNSIGKY